jgi:uncharacterized membrane protein YqjE
MDAGRSLGNLISAIKQDLTELFNVKLELLKLETYEKTSKLASSLIYGLILLFIAFFALFFAFFALGFWIGQLADNPAIGFGCVTLLYLIILVIIHARRKPILAYFVNLFLKGMDSTLENKEDIV